MDVVFAKVRQVHWTHITTTKRKNLLCEDVSLPETTSRVNMERYAISLQAPAARPVLPRKHTSGNKICNERHATWSAMTSPNAFYSDRKNVYPPTAMQSQHK